MFTSRAEYRLLLREDNADLRLTEIGHGIGLASEETCRRVRAKKNGIVELLAFLKQGQVAPNQAVDSVLASCGSAPLKNTICLAQLLRRPEVSLDQIRVMVPSTPYFSKDADLQAELQIKYAGYVDRQINLIERFQKMEHVRLPDEFDYSIISGLSREVREKLTRVRPRSLGQASRVPGITPAAISLLSVHLRKTRGA
jgi:tRNA uridine 5-carboxymethylaminomethyl modification enzyme